MAERLDAPAVADRLTRLEEVLGELETIPGATAAKALDAVTLLTEVYGEALARVLEQVPEAEALTGDELVGHLLVLHELHPEPLEQRVGRALERLRPLLRGGEARFDGVEGTVARVVLAGGGCGGPGQAAEVVRDAVLATAPELTEVQVSPARRKAAFIPVESLLGAAAPKAAP
ncbi:NifU family protein [Actinocorallia libanotica]|uniref:Fe-S cluster biogenesis protein NfuA n=1 Tax=Actinocorallia libanotica TaxID=46162 RepID=A0ABP4BF72_9ACTN